ncbi:MAG: Jag N-terminal domain-containing protein [Ilumatobacteraceae bacterium]
MEWVETTAKTLDEAKELALDQLGVTEDDAEFDVLEGHGQACSVGPRGEAGVPPGFVPRPLGPRPSDAVGARSRLAPTSTATTRRRSPPA